MSDNNGESTPLLPEASSPTKENSSFEPPSETSNRSVRFSDSESNDPRKRFKRSVSSISAIIRTFTRSERDRAMQRTGVGAAAFLIRDAVLGQVENPANGAYDPYKNPEMDLRNLISIICRRLCAYRPLLRLLHSAAWILVILTFIEPPYWCRSSNTEAADDSMLLSDADCGVLFPMKGIPADNSKTTEVQYYPNSSSMLLTVQQSHIVESFCLAIIIFFMLLRIGRDGMSLARYLRKGPARLTRIVQLVCLMLLIAGLASGYTFHHPYVRLFLLLSFLTGVQRDIRVLMKMLPEVFSILTLFGVGLLFYAWFGCVMFVDSDEGDLHFSNLVEAMWTLWICVTTANYPDVMMPAYNENRWVALYFVSFMLFSFFFLMNVILASVVNDYNSAKEARRVQRLKLQDENLRKAFKLMDWEKKGRIDRGTVMALFVILNEDFPEFRRLSNEDAKLVFAILDKDGSSTITEDEFMDFGTVMLLEFMKSSDYDTFVEIRFPGFYQSRGYQRFCRAVRSDSFEYAIDFILILNAIVIAIQSYPELSNQKVVLDPKYWDGSIDTVWEAIETVFTIIYCLEATAKITVFGWKAYSESQKNIFDLSITILAVVSSVIVYYPNEFSDSRLIRMIVMARVLRLVRVLTAMKQFQLIGAVSAEILPAAKDVVLVLFFLQYLFAVIGVHLYGGLITRDPSNPLAYLILDTEFSENDYWANNFNDMISALNVLFNLLVVNNWTQCEIGFEAATQAKWVRLFFLAFHIFGVILVNNLVIAFIINAFLQHLEVFREQNVDEIVDGEAVISRRRAFFDASEITGTKTSLRGDYIAQLRRTARDRDMLEGHDQDRLRHMFTHTSSLEDKGNLEGDAAEETI